MDIDKLKELIFEHGKNEGFTDMEVYYQSNSEFSCRVFKGEVDDYSTSQEGGISFRGLYNGQMGYAYTEKIDESATEILIEIAKENAEIIESDDNEIIFKGSKLYNKIDLYSEELANIPTERKLDFIKEVEKKAYELDKRVVNVGYCTYKDYENEKMLYNTNKLNKKEKSNIAVAYLSAVVQEKEEIQSADAFKVGQNFRDFDAESLAKKAVDRAISYLGAKPVESKSYTILLENTAAADLLGTFVGVFSAENVQKGRSLLKNKLGEAIGSLPLTIIDDPFMVDGVANRSFDSEGVASEKVSVIEEGILHSLLHNLKTAEKEGVQSTGHGYKASYKGTITIAPSNFYIQPGLNTYEDLMNSINEGLIITELEGLHAGANPVSGDFSLAAKGYYVKDGKIERPVNQITIASNFYEVLQNIEAVGDDLAFTFPSAGYIGSPTLKIKNISVAGE
ncbi:TldD/PmbA family protein [Alkaliphilus sp. B6464]|uniref:TldD/PmbA family protein n=1 Tax=Alkaliphilus sp. B6464 TaxID=2731219 RepID=UPI001BAD2B4F|nr:TldD/PmbA family protein [Alkaliphilus sp. B6464]QUH20147.1 TldD/PmbA family protein [Alkaliphilus sp. B6464]